MILENVTLSLLLEAVFFTTTTEKTANKLTVHQKTHVGSACAGL